MSNRESNAQKTSVIHSQANSSMQAKKHLHYFSSVGKQEVAASLTHTKLDEFHSAKSSPGMMPICRQSETMQENSGSTTSKANSQSNQNNEIVNSLVGKIAAQNSANFEVKDHFNSVAAT